MILVCIFSDVCGKMQMPLQTGNNYFMTFIDDASRILDIAFLKQKSEVLRHFKAFVERVERETGFKVKILQSDGGGEYGSKEFKSYLESKGIKHEKTNAYTLQENGVAERMNCTLVESACSMLNDANLPNSFWEDAVEYAGQIRNVVPTRALPNITPHESFTGNKPDVSHF
jgi:transposase InsO family protein